MLLPLYLLFFHLLLIQEKTLQESKFIPFFQNSSQPSFFKSQNTDIRKKAISQEQAEFIISVTTGNQRAYQKTKTSSLIKKFNLIHLITPSGLHVAILISLLFWIIRKNKYQISILLFFYLLLHFLKMFLAIQRIILLRILSLILKKHFSPFQIFLIAFVFEFLLGSYLNSPLSFYLSMLFLGIIYYHKEKPIYSLGGGFCVAQAIVCHYFESPIYLASIFLNTLLGISFPFLFLLSLLCYLFPITWFLKIHFKLYGYFIDLLKLFDTAPWDQWALSISSLTIILLISAVYFSKKRKFLCVLLVLNANHLNILDKEKWMIVKEKDLFPHSKTRAGK